jgi:putative spermidine/putrescine transport system permease protein
LSDSKRPNTWLLLTAILTFLFILGPILLMVVASFTPKDFLAVPPGGFSLKWYGNALNQKVFRDSFVTSLTVAVLSTLLSLLIGVPAALAITRFRFPGRDGLLNFFMSPIIVPEIVVGFALLQYLMVAWRVDVYWALIVGHAVILVPYAVRVTGASLAQTDAAIEEAARGLGAGPLKTFFQITLPVIRPGIVAASTLAFITSFNNVPLSLFLTGPGVSTLPIQMMIYTEYSFDPTVAAVSTLLLIMTVLFAYTAERMVGLKTLFAR